MRSFSFDGSARVKRGGGAYSAILWKLPEWTVIQARSAYAEDLTVNEAEYHGLLLCLDLLNTVEHKRVAFCGDSNLVIRQVRGEIECNAPCDVANINLGSDPNGHYHEDSDLCAEDMDQGLAAIPAIIPTTDEVRIEDEDTQDIITLNRLNEVLVVKRADQAAQITAVVTRSGLRSTIRTASDSQSLREEVVRDLRIDRIRQAQDKEAWISGLKKYLNGDLQDPTQQEAKSYANLAADYDLDHHDLLFYCPSTRSMDADRDKLMRLATYPFQIIAMDHISSLPRSHKGNTELLIFEDLLYVIAKASSSRTAQTVAESYEECVFRRFGASEAIRHDREPGFMSDFFRVFNKILGQRQRATMAYRPQANGSAERMVQTTTRAIKVYVQDLDERDWDEYAERITFAINTAHDRIRGETPFYMVHGWDPRSTLEAVMGSTRRHDRDPRRWRYQIQRCYQQVREQVNQRLREAISDRADLHNQEIRPHQIEVGSRVWLYLDRVKEGYAKKLAHLWHGPFRIVEKVGEHAVKLEIAGSGITFSLWYT
ncbi:LOW QUALITY PROTEIN: Reverse transcriptase [Phytophthora palmivora]|uniref:Reverse transcriptase n=1 Tax=Phytophthora palmivora TaxID=4796 RepID=A0A2P4Y522_9STRA|nr:LOW QUALITY PROTEIN: Reverse transcriptase [Phytophthora palmivora]